MEQASIAPLEEYVVTGIVDRLTEVFGCQTIVVTEQGKQATLQKLNEGNNITYPYAFAILKGVSANPESYNPHMLGRRGIPVIVEKDQATTVRLMPANFEFEFEYHTDKYLGYEQGSVMSLVRRWLFARRFGYLKFNINYGRLAISISATLNEAPVIPEKENSLEGEAPYKVSATLVVHGYVSEAMVSRVGVINDLVVDTVIKDTVESSQFIPFN